jgi:hypothetical protein
MENRKAFNFYKSYYDVVNELPVEDRLSFLMAILEKQFNNVEPELTGLSKFAYISQKHAIDAQVDGYISKIKNTPTQPPTQPPSVPPTEPPTLPPSYVDNSIVMTTEPPSVPPTEPPSVQEQEQEQEQEKVKVYSSTSTSIKNLPTDEELDKILEKLKK